MHLQEIANANLCLTFCADNQTATQLDFLKKTHPQLLVLKEVTPLTCLFRMVPRGANILSAH